MHIKLDEVLEGKLKVFAKNRSKSKSAVLRYSLENLFAQESVEPAQDAALETAISSVFSIPSFHTLKSFWGTLVQLAYKYPGDKSAAFWGDIMHPSEHHRTNKQTFTHIKERYDQEMRIYAKS